MKPVKNGYCSCDTQYAACENGEIHDCDDCRYWIEVKDDFIKHSKSSDWGGSIHVMERNGDAYVRVYWYNEDRNSVFIEGLSVSENARRKGLGNKYLKLCEDIGRNIMHSKPVSCYLSVEKDTWMYDWYKRKGYSFCRINNDQKNEVWMEKEL